MSEFPESPAASSSHTDWQHVGAAGRFSMAAESDEILQIAFTPANGEPHRTWSTAPSAAELAVRSADIENLDSGARLRTSAFQATAHLTPDESALQFDVSRRDGSPVLMSATVRLSESGRPVWESALADGERIFGGGERTGALNRRGRRLTFWTTDPLPNHGDQTDAMYQSVPLLIGLVADNAYGVYFDVNERAVADIGHTQAETLAYTPESADLVAYVLVGPTLGEVLRQYTSLTGHMQPLPRWAFGYHQSRWGYVSTEDVLFIARQFREQAIPCDAIYLDIDYMDGYRIFTWDPNRFPDPAVMIRRLGEDHLRLITIIDPGVKVDPDYRVYAEGDERSYFVRNPDGTSFKGWVWPGLSCWADFAQDAVRAWWGEQYRGLLEDGVAGIWIDMNEPAQAGMSAPADVVIPHGATLPDSVLHGAPGDTMTHARFHNAYGLEMAHATYDGLASLRPGERPFVLTRSATAGSQRYAIVWNGDSTSSWENLRLAIPLNLGVSLSGFPVTGGDVGGFWGDATGELLARWMQLGALLPFFRNHSCIGTAQQEPWAFGEPYTRVCRAAIELRYRLLPYLLSLAHEASATGAPMVRPLAWNAPTDNASLNCDNQFVLGEAVLAAPVLEQKATARVVILPPGEWFTWESSELHVGGQPLAVPVILDSLPLYVRAGAMLPLAAVAQSTDDMTSQPLTWHVYLSPGSPSATGHLWLDDDHTEAEQRQAFGSWLAEAQWHGDEITVTMHREAGQLAWPFPGCSVALHLPDGWRVEAPSEIHEGDTFTALHRISHE
jgi:alpha-glucosidase